MSFSLKLTMTKYVAKCPLCAPELWNAVRRDGPIPVNELYGIQTPFHANCVVILMLNQFLVNSSDAGGGSPHTCNSQAPAGCPTIQHDSDTFYAEPLSDPKEEGSVLQTALSPHSRCQSRLSPGLLRFPRPPPGVRLIC